MSEKTVILASAYRWLNHCRKFLNASSSIPSSTIGFLSVPSCSGWLDEGMLRMAVRGSECREILLISTLNNVRPAYSTYVGCSSEMVT
jgi:hypothetical protein